MSDLSTSVTQILQASNRSMNTVLLNPYAMAALKITLVLLAIQVSPKVPEQIASYFNNFYGRALILTFILVVSKTDFQLALLVSVLYLMSINFMENKRLLESFGDYVPDYVVQNPQLLIEPRSMIYPGCDNMTMADLLTAFNGDQESLIAQTKYAFYDLMRNTTNPDALEKIKMIAFSAGLPYNRQFTDKDAPYIATILLNSGFSLGGMCTPPQ